VCSSDLFENDPLRYPYAICREGEHLVGFCGGCHVAKQYAMGGWSFILLDGATPRGDGKHLRRGIGTVLLTMANLYLKEQGALGSV
jgi:hypothetical protein